MNRRFRILIAAMLAGLVVLAACSKKERQSESRTLAEFVVPHDSLSALRFLDTNLISINTRCPVKGTRLSPKVPPVYVNGQPVAFCCAPCPDSFRRTPEVYLRQMNADFKCVVHSADAAVLDPGHRAMVNDGIFYFSSPEALRAFVTEPWRYTGSVSDPVSGTRFQPDSQSPRRSFGGRLFFFQSAENASAFDADPRAYVGQRPARPSKS